MRIKELVVGLVFCGAGFAQEPTLITKIVRVHGDPVTLRQLACDGGNVGCQANGALKAVVVKGREPDVDRAEKAIQELDSISPAAASAPANKNVDLTIYVLGGSDKPFVGAQDLTSGVLMPVVKQLRAVFPYSHYQLLSTMVVRSSLNKKAESSGMMSVQLNPDVQAERSNFPPTVYQVQFSPTLANGDSGQLHLSGFEFNTRVPYVSGMLRGPGDKGGSSPYATMQFQEINVGIQTDVDLQEGQKVVVSKTNVSDSDSCFFLVLSAKLVP